MGNVILIHRAFGNPDNNWFPWLRKELEKKGSEVFVPRFPTPEGQTLERWMKAFGPYRKYVNEETVFIGHSLGVPFILSLLETFEKPVKACFFVAGFTGPVGIEKFDRINSSFAMKKFRWERIIKNSGKFSVFHSDNDPYLPMEKAEQLAESLGVKVALVKGAGHFNSASGYGRFPQLLEKILPA